MPILPINQHSTPSLQRSVNPPNQVANTGSEQAPMPSTPSFVSSYNFPFDDEFKHLYEAETQTEQPNPATPYVLIKAYDATSINNAINAVKKSFHIEIDPPFAIKCLSSIMSEVDCNIITAKNDGYLTLSMLSNHQITFNYFTKLRALGFKREAIIKMAKYDSAYKTFILLTVHHDDFKNLQFNNDVITKLCCIPEAYKYLEEIHNYFELMSTDIKLSDYYFTPQHFLDLTDYDYPAQRLRQFANHFTTIRDLFINEKLTTHEILCSLTIEDPLYFKRSLTTILKRKDRDILKTKRTHRDKTAKRKHAEHQIAHQQTEAQIISCTVLNPMKISTLCIDQAMQNPREQMTFVDTTTMSQNHPSPIETYETTLSHDTSHAAPYVLPNSLSISTTTQNFSSDSALTYDLMINDDFEQLFQAEQLLSQNSQSFTATTHDTHPLNAVVDHTATPHSLILHSHLSSHTASLFYLDNQVINELVEHREIVDGTRPTKKASSNRKQF